MTREDIRSSYERQHGGY